jgi:hypothetical protein
VTEKYLLRGEKEWQARQQTNQIFDNILEALKTGDTRQLATNTARNWEYPIKTIIPWASTHYTERIIAQAKQEFGEDYYGFLMLGGMSGGGMGMFVNPEHYETYKLRVLELLRPKRACPMHCPSPWNRWCTTGLSTKGAPGPACTPASTL